MKRLCDYMILQRDGDGFARVVWEGESKEEKHRAVYARVVREDDNTMIVPWQKCVLTGEHWSTKLLIPQGGLYRVEARGCGGDESATHNNYDWADLIDCAAHVGVGDIFVFAGQSNMSGYGKDPAYDPPQLGVHLYDNSGNWVLATHPLGSVPNPIYPNNDPASGTSPGLAFARMMYKRLGVPIGLVSASLGGSPLRAWNPAEEDCYLYRAMEQKLEAVGSFTGMLWYQGCNETGSVESAGSYFEKFSQAVSLWREKFGYFPIATCQLNRHAYAHSQDRLWGILREAQRKASEKIPGVFIVPTNDLYTIDGIHNASGANIVIGERLANVLLKGHYSLPGAFAPDVKSIRKTDNRHIVIRFRQPHMLRTMDDSAAGFNIEDENGIMDCTQATATEDGLTVTAARDIGSSSVFHAYWRHDQSAFFVRDIYGMPMLSCYGVKIED